MILVVFEGYTRTQCRFLCRPPLEHRATFTRFPKTISHSVEQIFRAFNVIITKPVPRVRLWAWAIQSRSISASSPAPVCVARLSDAYIVHISRFIRSKLIAKLVPLFSILTELASKTCSIVSKLYGVLAGLRLRETEQFVLLVFW